ncbi:MAG: ion transporter [Arenimonas sp.]
MVSIAVEDWRSRLASFLDSKKVTGLVIGLIVLNAIILGLEAIPVIANQYLSQLHWADHLLLGIFVAELALRMTAHGKRFFYEPWHIFDFVIIAIALVPASEAFSVLRALRILRVLRLVSMVPSMRRVVGALLSALPGMGAIVMLLMLVLYISAVMATKLFSHAAPEFFGDLGSSLFTLFQIMTVEGWPDIARNVMKVEPFAWIFFVGYLVMATFTVLNLFIAVIVNAMQETFDDEKKVIIEAEQKDMVRDSEILKEIRMLRSELAAMRKLEI